MVSVTMSNDFKQVMIGRHFDGMRDAGESRFAKSLEHYHPSNDLVVFSEFSYECTLVNSNPP